MKLTKVDRQNYKFWPRAQKNIYTYSFAYMVNQRTKERKLCNGNRLSIPSLETEIKTEDIKVLLQHIIINTCKTTREEKVS